MPNFRPFSLAGRNLEETVIVIEASGLAVFHEVDHTPDHPMAREGCDVLLFMGCERLVPRSVAWENPA